MVRGWSLFRTRKSSLGRAEPLCTLRSKKADSDTAYNFYFAVTYDSPRCKSGSLAWHSDMYPTAIFRPTRALGLSIGWGIVLSCSVGSRARSAKLRYGTSVGIVTSFATTEGTLECTLVQCRRCLQRCLKSSVLIQCELLRCFILFCSCRRPYMWKRCIVCASESAGPQRSKKLKSLGSYLTHLWLGKAAKLFANRRSSNKENVRKFELEVSAEGASEGCRNLASVRSCYCGLKRFRRLCLKIHHLEFLCGSLKGDLRLCSLNGCIQNPRGIDCRARCWGLAECVGTTTKGLHIYKRGMASQSMA